MVADPDANDQVKHRSWMARAGQSMIDVSENQGCWPLIYRWLRRLTLVSVVIYLVGLLALILALSRIGERNVATAFLLFLPPSLWWLPALPLGLAALLFHRKSLLALLLVMLWVGYAFLGWRSGGEPVAAGEDVLRVMTYNRGQNMNQSLQPFKALTHPDIIVFQEAYGRAAGFKAAPEYGEFIEARNMLEHTILSRYPILEEKALPGLPGKSPKAIRFVIDWKGRQVAVYSVHLQSPREILQYQMRGGFLYGLLGFPGSPWETKKKDMQKFWSDQIADAEIVIKAVREDPLPAIVAGDFNAPSIGYVHRRMLEELGDAHDQAGSGFGWSFPGTTRNPLSAGGPWMRIDYLFFNKGWEVLQCITEEERPSQHRAVMAIFRLKKPIP